MLALCKVEATEGGIGLRNVAVSEPGPGEIRIKVAAAGICGTDMQIYKWAPRMARRMKLPRVLGHEVSGVVDALGPGVSNVKLGDHVSLESHVFCGQCKQCRTQRAHLCVKTTYPGIDFDGGFADYAVVPASIAWVNPPDMPHEIAAMQEPYGIAVHASLEGSGVSGQSVLVNGCGPIGLMNVAAARALGARQIIACDPNPLRLATAKTMGADRCVNPKEEDVVKVVRDMTDGDGVDVGIEYSGTEAGFRAVFECLTKGGDFRLVGAPSAPIPVDFSFWLLKCPRMINIHGRRIWESWVQASALLRAGKVDLRPLASHVLPLSEATRGFELILAGQAVKPILIPGA
jgi:threonine 3-dehydrogenase